VTIGDRAIEDRAIEYRAVTDGEFGAYHRAESTAFGTLPHDARREIDRSVVELDRTVAAFDGDEIVGTTAAYSFEMTLPGGGRAPVAGVTGVGVVPTHRRRGILTTMMGRLVDDSITRGDVAAVLNASESSIYERFGYGRASELVSWSVDTRDAAFLHPPARCRLRLVPQHDAAEVLADLYDPYRRDRPGSVSRRPEWWAAMLADHRTWKGGGELFVVVAEPEPGAGRAGGGGAGGGRAGGGYVIYRVEPTGEGAFKRLEVLELAAVDDEVETALWRYCTEVDLVRRVVTEARPVDDPLPWRLADPRRLTPVIWHDYLWVRPLDVVGLLGTRRYRAPGTLVLEVVDGDRPDLGGTFRLVVEAADGTARVERLAPDGDTVRADLRLGAADLGSLSLGGVSPTVLARAGRVTELAPGAVARAELVFPWDRLPFCATRF
jgi:predicted acetyltransferase